MPIVCLKPFVSFPYLVVIKFRTLPHVFLSTYLILSLHELLLPWIKMLWLYCHLFISFRIPRSVLLQVVFAVFSVWNALLPSLSNDGIFSSFRLQLLRWPFFSHPIIAHVIILPVSQTFLTKLFGNRRTLTVLFFTVPSNSAWPSAQ